MPDPILILAPLRMEAAALRDGLAKCAPATNVQVLAIGLHARHLPALPAARGIVLAGLAGALDPALRVGDVIVDSASTPMPRSRVHAGTIASVSAAVCSTAAKAALARATDAVAVEMECAALRPRLPAGVPFLHLRAISDTAATALDPAILTLIDDTGRPRPAAVAALLLRRPGLVGPLRRLQADSRRALAQLVTTLATILQDWP
jgi:hypothetical protein